MRSILKEFLIATIIAGVFVAVLGAPAMAFSPGERTDTFNQAVNLDSTVINGVPADGSLTGDSAQGRLWVVYYKTNGTKTSAKAATTQHDTYTSDTVLGVPTGILTIMSAYDADSKAREFGGGLNSWGGWVGANSKMERLPRDTNYVLPENGETQPLQDSLCILVIETNDTGSARLKIINTSNYACSFVLLIHYPDTDFAIGNPPQGGRYNNEVYGVRDRFIGSLGQHADTGNGPQGDRNDTLTAGDSIVRVQPHVLSAVLAEEGETTFYVRFAADTIANARDSLSVTIQLIGDTEYQSIPWGGTRHMRIWADTGYLGDNDTRYGEGSSQDSVSIFVLVATAIVRVKKTDSIFTPASYREAVRWPGQTDTRDRMRDTVPGAIIVYTLTYDNDGNRRADTVIFTDYIDSNVDWCIKAFPDSYGITGDTLFPYFGHGVDTRTTHGRWSTGTDTGVTISFSTRAAATVFNAETYFPGDDTYAIMETVAAVRINWAPYTTRNEWSLRRDQADEFGTYSGNVMDPLESLDSLAISPGSAGSVGDSGDCGRFRFAVIIR